MTMADNESTEGVLVRVSLKFRGQRIGLRRGRSGQRHHRFRVGGVFRLSSGFRTSRLARDLAAVGLVLDFGNTKLFVIL